MKRLEMYSADVAKIKGCSLRRGREILAEMKKYYNKKKHQIITINEGSQYLGIDIEDVKRLLFVFSFWLMIGCTSCQAQQPSFWKDIKYFTPEEFYVNGETKAVNPALVKFLDATRDRIEESIIITSGVRSRRHNASVGGVDGSDHIYGNAVDIKIKDARYLSKLIINIIELAAITRPVKVIVYDGHLHLSIDTGESLVLFKP